MIRGSLTAYLCFCVSCFPVQAGVSGNISNPNPSGANFVITTVPLFDPGVEGHSSQIVIGPVGEAGFASPAMTDIGAQIQVHPGGNVPLTTAGQAPIGDVSQWAPPPPLTVAAVLPLSVIPPATEPSLTSQQAPLAGPGAPKDGAQTAAEGGETAGTPVLREVLGHLDRTTGELRRSMDSGGEEVLRDRALGQFQPLAAVLTNLAEGEVATGRLPPNARRAVDYFNVRSPFPVGLVLLDDGGDATKISVRVLRDELLRPGVMDRLVDGVGGALERETGYRLREFYVKAANPGVPFDTVNFVLDRILDRSRLDAILNDPGFTPEKLIAELKKDPFLRELYEKPAGVWEGFSLERHTLMMMGQFERYFSRFAFDAPMDKGMFRLLLALHDIGKPLNKAKQHELTGRIMRDYLARLRYTPQQIDLLVSGIMDGDPIGPLLRIVSPNPRPGQSAVSLEDMIREVEKMARQSGVSARQLLPWILVFYLSDAGSYTDDARLHVYGDGLRYKNDGTEKARGLDYPPHPLFLFDHANGSMSLAPHARERVAPLFSHFGVRLSPDGNGP